MKHGQLQSSVIWVFILIAGGSFLLLFFYIGQAQTEIQSDQSNARVAAQVQDIISTMQANPNVDQTLSGFPSQMEFRCIAGSHQYILPSLDDSTGPLRTQQLYTPTNLAETRLRVFTAQHTYPYTSTTLVYLAENDFTIDIALQPLSSTETNRLQEVLRKIIPSRIQQGGANAHTILLGSAAPPPSQRQISVAVSSENTGTITFPSGATFDFEDPSIVVAAAMTANKSLFDCIHPKTQEAVLRTHRINRERAAELRDAADPGTCLNIYDKSIGNFTNLETALQNRDISTYTAASEDLLERNRDLVANSCEPIF